MSETAPPQVDVGVVTWNTGPLTADSLRRLIDGERQCQVRVLVHDNGSTDGTAELLARRVPEAEVERCEQNLGFAAGVNRLLERSVAPWFVTLNSDAWPEPGALARLVRAAQEHPEAAAVAPLLLRPDDSVEHSTHPFPSLRVALVDAVCGRRWLPPALLERHYLEGAWRQDRLRSVDWAVGAALLFRREALDAVGPLDERFFMYVEDLEWCWRARQHGWTVMIEPAAVVRHVGGVSGARRWGDTRTGLEAANLRVFLGEALGAKRAAAYRALQAAAAGHELVRAKLQGRRDLAAHWRLQLNAQLGLEAPPPVTPAPAEPSEPSCAPADPETGGRATALAVVVPTRGRAGRLARLVTALEAQTIDPDAFEVVVVDDGSTDDTAAVLEHLAARSPLHIHVHRNPTCRGPAAARNRGWRCTDAPVVAFTDDDCVPDPHWLQAGLEALGGRRRLVVGRTLPPPGQSELGARPFSQTISVDSTRFFETCNVFYRRRDLEAVGGFDERFRRPSGEDTHLGLNVAALGVEAVYADKAVVYHDVRCDGLLARIRETLRWADLPLVVAGRPWARRGRAHRLIFWKPTHPSAILAGVGLVLGLRWRAALVLVLPWLRVRLATVPECAGAWCRIRNLPGALALDLCEVAVMARGSLRHRTVLL